MPFDVFTKMENENCTLHKLADERAELIKEWRVLWDYIVALPWWKRFLLLSRQYLRRLRTRKGF